MNVFTHSVTEGRNKGARDKPRGKKSESVTSCYGRLPSEQAFRTAERWMFVSDERRKEDGEE